MVSKAILDKHGITAENWRKLLEKRTADPNPRNTELTVDAEKPTAEVEKERKLERLHTRIRSRVEAGREYNLLNYRPYQALRLIWNAPYRQINPTLLADMLSKYRPGQGNAAENELNDVLTGLGLNLDEVLYDTGEIDPKDPNKTKKALNVPAFHAIIVPLVRSYIEIRRSKIFNDRNLRPLHKFESPISDADNRLRCEVITSRVQQAVEQYGSVEVVKQAIFMMLLYGNALEFTLEDWHYEEQNRFATGEDAARLRKEDKDVQIGDEVTYTAREGLRKYLADPARMYWDFAHPMWTFNTGGGCEFAGYWRVLRYKDIRDNENFYNKDRLSYSTDPSPWWSASVNFFNSVYNTCVMKWPTLPNVPEGEDRHEFMAKNAYYNESWGDHSIVVTEHRELVTPSQDGLGDYDHPVWARFVLAGDNSTIIYAEPLCYSAVVAWRYNGDDAKIEDASMGLQLMPSQDLLSNLLSQFILTVKQNLTNITLIDETVLTDENNTQNIWKRLKNMGERFYRNINIFKFDSKKLMRYGVDRLPQAFYSHRFPFMDTNGILQSIKLVLDLAERVLQFSAQEVAQAATHEQTRKEIESIMSSTSNILQFTGHPVDAAMAAEARQWYEALMNYGDDDFYAFIPLEKKLDEKDLERLHITYVTNPGPKDKRGLVRVNKSALDLVWFAIVPSYFERKENQDWGRLISELVRDWFINNPLGQSALGPDQLVELFNQVARMINLPLDRPLQNVGLMTEQQNQANQQMLDQKLVNFMADVKEGSATIMQNLANLYQALGIPMPNENPSNANPLPAGAGAAPPALALPAGGGPPV